MAFFQASKKTGAVQEVFWDEAVREGNRGRGSLIAQALLEYCCGVNELHDQRGFADSSISPEFDVFLSIYNAKVFN